MTTQYIDLYPEALRRRSVFLSAAQVALACLALALALGAWSVLTRNHTRTLAAQAAQIEQQLKAERDQLAALGQQVQAQKADPMLSAQLAGAEALLAARREAIAVLEQGRIGSSRPFSMNNSKNGIPTRGRTCLQMRARVTWCWSRSIMMDS